MKFATKSAACVVIALAAFLVIGVPSVQAQHGSEGTVTITVLDPSGSVVQGADLELRDTATNSIRRATTQEQGIHTFPSLSLGKYSLTVKKAGFQSQEFTDVIVQAAKTTDITANLKVGAISETVQVTGGTAPLVETTTNAIGTNIDMKQIEDLPLQGRNLAALSQLVPGYGGVNGSGTYDGLPAIAQGNNIDGVISSTSRMKFGGNDAPDLEPRLESMQEMTVQTEQLNLDQGFGQSNMQLNFVTRRGSNAFHGRVYEDFRNSSLDANSWLNDTLTAIDPTNPAKKNHLILNEFGVSVGGPIIKDKLFFFGTYAESKQPGAYTALNYLFTQAAQTGNFTYNGNTVNLFTLAANCNANPSCSQGQTLPIQVNQNSTQKVFSAANSAASAGNLSPNAGDPNLQNLNWKVPNPTTQYFPTVRVDFDATQKMRFNLAWNMTKIHRSGDPGSPPDFPGSDWAKTGAGYAAKFYTAGFGFDWTLSPSIVNDFRGGYLYHAEQFAAGASPLDINSPQLGWSYTNIGGPQNTMMSGTVFNTGVQTLYPIFNVSDTMTWQHGAHTMNFGFSWWREQNHYYNPVQGFPVVNFGLATGDPARNAFTAGGTLPNTTANDTNIQAEAQQLYAILAARIASVGGSYAFNPATNDYTPAVGRYNLDEVTGGTGLFFQDSYRIKPNLTLNFGLRWDFTRADRDLTNLYHSVTTSSMFGPSGVWNLFNPGSFKGDPNPSVIQISQAYQNWNVSPQPAIGIAWNPSNNGFGRRLGGDKTVIRAGFSLRKLTEPQQYVWNQATDYQAYYYQIFALNANATGQPGTFVPGTLSMDNFTPGGDPTTAFGIPYIRSPQTYLKTEPAADFTFLGGPGFFGPLNGIKSDIQQPYTESWNLGIQRQLGESRALELRYVGSRTLRQWITVNPNEVNIFENGFLSQFKAAQQNLAINAANGITSFANNGFAGQQALPIFDAAFAGEASGGAGIPLADYGDSGFITQLNNGAAGAMAGVLANINGAAPYFCNLVGASFAPCVNNAGFPSTNPGAGYPSNFFVANPYGVVPGGPGGTYAIAEGYSNYNAMQVDFRQRQWHGMQFDANYTWSHTLGTGTQNNWQGQTNVFSLRNMRLSYGPALFDLKHVIHISGSYDLPFGKGKQFANRGGVVDHIIGGWTVGTIFTFQTGAPFYLIGGTNTFNDYGDGGIVLNGITASQLQSGVGSYHIPGTTSVAFINPKYLNPSGGANPAFISQNTTPGTIGQRVWLYGPHNTFDDISITKRFPITERLRFSLQAEMLNAFNHPTFGPGATNGAANFGFNVIQSGGFGLSNGTLSNANAGNPNSPNGGARVIELRANVEF